MKLRKWVIALILIIANLFIALIFFEPIIYNVIGLFGFGACVFLYTKYSGICD